MCASLVEADYRGGDLLVLYTESHADLVHPCTTQSKETVRVFLKRLGKTEAGPEPEAGLVSAAGAGNGG